MDFNNHFIDDGGVGLRLMPSSVTFTLISADGTHSHTHHGAYNVRSSNRAAIVRDAIVDMRRHYPADRYILQSYSIVV
jgi:hypothetical protein